MIDYGSVVIEGINFSATGHEEVHQNLKMLFTTPEGSVAFDRSFGISTAFMDQPLPVAKNRLLVEYIEKTKLYEPRASIQEVFFNEDSKSGSLIPKVVVEVDLKAV